MHSSFRNILIALLFSHATSLSAEDWSLCTVPAITHTSINNPADFATEITADQVQRQTRDVLEFTGDVLMLRENQRMAADTIVLLQNPDRMSANGNIKFSDELLTLDADLMQSDNSRDYSLFQNASFTLHEIHLRGTTSRLEQTTANVREFEDVRYTTCDPDSNVWSMSASRLRLDDESGMGTAYHSVFRLGPVPVFYFPWFRFPITDQRMSGFLPPLLSESSSKGTVYSFPFYWNLAEHYDMTIDPIWYRRRGTQLNTENRYLFEHNSGEVRLSQLEDERDDQQRWFRYWNHQSYLGAGVRASLLIQRVSDVDFVRDFDNLKHVEDVDYLMSKLELSATPGGWNATMLFDEYQVVDPLLTAASAPYKRLPRVTFDKVFSANDNPGELDWRNEWVIMEHDQRVSGQRLHASPHFSYPVEGDYYFVTPALQLNLTHYDLQDTGVNEPNQIDRSIHQLSVDSGLFFERISDQAGDWLQTLEPRLYMLYVPYEDQSKIPLFDTSLLSETFDTIFTNNRFSGADRIGDSKQISLGLTTRIIDLRSGREVFSAGLARAAYLENRRVLVSDTRDKSGLMTKIGFSPSNQLRFDILTNYDRDKHEFESSSSSVRYQNGATVLNLEYHLVRNSLEQSTIAVVAPLSPALRLYFKKQHSIKHNKPVQNLGGFSWESCCWRFDALYEESTDDSFIETDRSVYFQLTFKGFGGAGNDIPAQLEEDILGYRSPY